MTTPRIGWRMRWTQAGHNGEEVGRRIYEALEEAQAVCDSVNAFWQGQVNQWPEEVALDASPEPTETPL